MTKSKKANKPTGPQPDGWMVYLPGEGYSGGGSRPRFYARGRGKVWDRHGDARRHLTCAATWYARKAAKPVIVPVFMLAPDMPDMAEITKALEADGHHWLAAITRELANAKHELAQAQLDGGVSL
jgi:hypothetical protein